jgi:hypothetical protein
MSIARAGLHVGEQNPFYGKTHDDDIIAILSQKAKDRYQTNPAKYDQLNIEQCVINTEDCVKIQRQYLQGVISMEEMAKTYSVPITTIHRILHGEYSAIRGHSIITEELLDQIINDRHKRQVAAYKILSVEQEREIANKYSKGTILVKDLATEYDVCKPTISKALKAQGIKPKRGPIKRKT